MKIHGVGKEDLRFYSARGPETANKFTLTTENRPPFGGYRARGFGSKSPGLDLSRTSGRPRYRCAAWPAAELLRSPQAPVAPRNLKMKINLSPPKVVEEPAPQTLGPGESQRFAPLKDDSPLPLYGTVDCLSWAVLLGATYRDDLELFS